MQAPTCENRVNAGLLCVSALTAAYNRPDLSSQQTMRVAVIDDDSGFVTVLAKRTEAAGWQQRQVGSAIPAGELVAMKLNALLLDPAVLGEEAWDYIERVCGMLH